MATNANRGSMNVIKPLISLFFYVGIFLVLTGTSSDPVASQNQHVIGPDEVRERVLVENYGVRIQKLNATKTLEELNQYDARFDTELFAQLGGGEDQLEKNSIFAGNNKTIVYGVGARKRLQTGTQLELAWEHNRLQTTSQIQAINPSHESRIDLSIRQPLLYNAFGLIDRGNRKILETQINAQRTEFNNSIENILAQTLNLYWDLVFAFEAVRIREENVTQAQNLLEIQKRKKRIGLVEEPDLLDTQVTLKIAEKNLLISKNNLENAQERLRQALNYSEEETLIPEDNIALPENQIELENELSNAFRSRRDWQQLKDDIEANQIALKVAKNARWPQLDLVATLSSNGLDADQADAIGRAFRVEGWEYFVGGELSYPIEQRGRKAEAHRALLDKTRLVLSMKELEKNIQQNIRIAVREIHLAREISQQNLEISRLQKLKYQAQTRKFRQGRSTSDLVIRFLNDARLAEFNAALSVTDYHRTIIALLQIENRLLNEIDMDDEGRRIFN